MNEIESIQKQIIEEFSFFEDWTQRYEHMIELGKALPLIDKTHKTEENIIKGCQSKVWIHAHLDGDKVKFTADSDAIITKGYMYLASHFNPYILETYSINLIIYGSAQLSFKLSKSTDSLFNFSNSSIHSFNSELLYRILAKTI